MQTFLKTVLPYVFCILAGYLAGAVNFAWLLAKKRGFDIRTKGSGNAGTTNAGRTMGSGVAAVVFLCDALKSALMVWLAGFLFHSSPSIQTVTMAACVAGHLYPFYLEFQGGKGIAVLLGSALALDWRLFLILVAGVAVLLVGRGSHGRLATPAQPATERATNRLIRQAAHRPAVMQ